MGLLEKKVALITGSGSGIGQGIAQRFAREGAKVVINYIGSSEGAEHTLEMVQGAGGEGITVQADITKPDERQNLMEQAYSKFGALDILVNNAGVEKKALFVDVKEADYDEVLSVNLKGPYFLTQIFVQKLLAAKRPGRIVNISSVHEDMVFPGFSTYCISKGGMRMWMRDLAVELGPNNITVNNIAPGAIETPINERMMQDKAEMHALIENIPLQRMGKPDDVAKLAAFLASENAEYITGSTYVIDGGLMRNYREQ